MTTGSEGGWRAHWPVLLAAWIGLSSTAATLWLLWSQVGVDYAVQWAAANGANPYARDALPFAYPPTTLLWLAPLRLVAMWPGFVVWTIASVLLFAWASWRLYDARPTALAIISPAISIALLPGQTSLIAAAALIAAFTAKSPIWRGALLGAVLTFKPQLVLLAPLVLLFAGERIAFAAMAVVAASICALATAILGVGIWSDWLGSIPHFNQVVSDRGLWASAVSPAAFARAIDIPMLPMLVLGCLAGLALASRAGRLDDAHKAALVATASLFAAPYALRYDLVAIAPLMSMLILSRPVRDALVACVAYSASFGPLCLFAAAYGLWPGKGTGPKR